MCVCVGFYFAVARFLSRWVIFVYMPVCFVFVCVCMHVRMFETRICVRASDGVWRSTCILCKGVYWNRIIIECSSSTLTHTHSPLPPPPVLRSSLLPSPSTSPPTCDRSLAAPTSWSCRTAWLPWTTWSPSCTAPRSASTSRRGKRG